MTIKYLLVFIFLVLIQSVNAAVKRTIRDGKWSNPLIWEGKTAQSIPKLGDEVYINHYVELDQNLEFAGGLLIVSANGTMCGQAKVVINFSCLLTNNGSIFVSTLHIFGGKYIGDTRVISANNGTMTYSTEYQDCNTTDVNKLCYNGARAVKLPISCKVFPNPLFSIILDDTCGRSCATLIVPFDVQVNNNKYFWEVGINPVVKYAGTITSPICTTIDIKLPIVLIVNNRNESDSLTTLVQMYVSPPLLLKLPNDTAICEGQAIEIIPLATNSNTVWWKSTTNISCVNCATTTYTAEKDTLFKKFIATVYGKSCSLSDTMAVKIIKNDKNFITDKIVCRQGVLSIDGVFLPGNLFWNDGSTLDFIPIVQSGEYIATITNQCGTKTDTAYVKFIDPLKYQIPNVITPNGDGVNEQFEILGLETYDEIKLLIYNRWGNKIYETDKYFTYWDAKNNTDGLYYYSLETKDCDKIILKNTGTLQVIR